MTDHVWLRMTNALTGLPQRDIKGLKVNRQVIHLCG